jgi:DNA-binding MarR family transcriptional regulator
MSNDCPVASGSQERFTFAQLPLAMRRDTTLKPIDLAVVMFILPWMRGRPYGWTTIGRIAEGADVSERSVQYSLRRLEKRGWLEVQPSKINPTRREFTAQWLTDEGFEKLASGLGIDGYTNQMPQLVYSPTLRDFAPQEQDASRSSTLHPLEVASMNSVEQEGGARSPSGETALNSTDSAPDPVEDARNAAAIGRGVRGLYRSRVPWGMLGGPVACLARLAARRLDDDHSHSFHCGVLWRIADGDLTPEVYLKALETAVAEPRTREGEEIVRRGARFHEMLKAMEVRRTDAEFADEWADQHGLAV